MRYSFGDQGLWGEDAWKDMQQENVKETDEGEESRGQENRSFRQHLIPYQLL